MAELEKQSLISVDTETTHVSPRYAEIVGYSFAFKPNEAYYIPVRGPAGDRVLDPQQTLAALRPVLENPAIRKIGQNLKYDMIVLRNVGVTLAGLAFDTMIASYLLDAGGRSHNLDDLAQKYLNHTTIKIDQLIGKGRDQKRMDEVPVADVGAYAAEDADIPLRMHPILAERLQEMELTTLNETVEVPLIEVLAELEFTGIRIDPARLAELSQRYGERLAVLEQEIEELAGHPLNIASPKQLAQVLFQELGLPVVKKTKTGPSTDADVLEQLAESHPLPKKIVEYRQYSKLKNTYVDALPTMIHPETGRVHMLVQPGRRRHRPAQLQRPQPAKHSHPHRGRPRNPLRFCVILKYRFPSSPRRGGAGGGGNVEAARRRLLANRTANPGPLFGRRIDVRRVRSRRRHPHASRQPGLRRAA